jgi:ABC-type multidrug transport system ATPase subunit
LGVVFNEDVTEFIEVYVISKNLKLPIDSVGTGILQTIQIFAYLEYFKPKILLLDEPDSHIHPTKQRLLANELYKRTKIDIDLKIIISTHSRYILEALEDSSQVIHFQQGEAFKNIQGSKILLDIGAADADYLFSKKSLKYIIATEDKVDNIEEKKEFLRKFLIANGLSDDEVVLHSYEGCTKIHFAKLLEGFVRKHIPSVKVIVHIDRDQRDDSDSELQKVKEDSKNQNILLFVTRFSEIENFFCCPEHIHNIYGIPIEDCKEIYQKCLTGLAVLTKNKIRNFIMNSRRDRCLNKDGRIDTVVIEDYVQDFYDRNYEIVTPGKELLGRIKECIQGLKFKPNDILKPSVALKSDNFQELITR